MQYLSVDEHAYFEIVWNDKWQFDWLDGLAKLYENSFDSKNQVKWL